IKLGVVGEVFRVVGVNADDGKHPNGCHGHDEERGPEDKTHVAWPRPVVALGDCSRLPKRPHPNLSTSDFERPRLQAAMSDERTYAQPSRRGPDRAGVACRTARTGWTVSIVRDTSGSMIAS